MLAAAKATSTAEGTAAGVALSLARILTALLLRVRRDRVYRVALGIG
jgi:hypothetical protein